MTPAGILLIDKQPGYTSFRSLSSIKRHIHKKIGHSGTLDKFARGLLVVLVGPMTKLNPFFSGLDKTYIAQICFGTETETLDPEGAITAQGPVPAYEDIQRACTRFTGRQEQVPPEYSAVHVNGKRAYKSARAGQKIEIAPRTIEIYSLTPQNWDPPYLTVEISCSKGTYIRSLARDMGRSLGSCAYVSGLTRTQVGPFSLKDAVPAETAQLEHLITGREVFNAIGAFSFCVIEEPFCSRVLHGSLPQDSWYERIDLHPDSSQCVLYTPAGELLGLANIRKEVDNGVCFSSFNFVVSTGS